MPESRIEMHLESTREQGVSIIAAQVDLHFEKGETIHTENSYKFTDMSVRVLMRDSGFEMSDIWKDVHSHYAVVLARPAVACQRCMRISLPSSSDEAFMVVGTEEM
jgi:L-histidine Nalpha-methyltransferase